MSMNYYLIDGELTGDKLDEMETTELTVRLFSTYVKDIGIWIKILWAIVSRFFLLILCVITYIVMLRYKPTRTIITAMYIFFAIFWGFFPYAFKCVLMYKITSISHCIHAVFYAIIGLICWIIALAMYNVEQLEEAKGRVNRVRAKATDMFEKKSKGLEDKIKA